MVMINQLPTVLQFLVLEKLRMQNTGQGLAGRVILGLRPYYSLSNMHVIIILFSAHLLLLLHSNVPKTRVLDTV